MSQAETKLLASVLYELRIVLSGVAGPNAPHEVQFAWHLAYALHNAAEAVIDGKGFGVEGALYRIANIDRIIGGNDGQRVAGQIRRAISGTPASN
jgi:hypothetical protein